MSRRRPNVRAVGPEKWPIPTPNEPKRKNSGAFQGSRYVPKSAKHKSETALSLFMFGNMDGWKQLGQTDGPRNQKGKWSQAFFDAVRGQGSLPAYPPMARWSLLNHGV